MPRFDVFFSLIVLQHNPPPLIAFLLRTLLNKLEPGGLAYFQVPTYRFGYRFDPDAYIASELKLGVPEMHVLPQHVVLRIADEAGCRPLEVREDPSGSYDLISQRFLLHKVKSTAPKEVG
jgi:SAM-dependent methyltransferase